MGQEQEKYHVSKEGKVFRINDDGSFTELGNAEDLNKAYTNHSYEVKRRSWLWFIPIVCLIVGGMLFLPHTKSSEHINILNNASTYESPQSKDKNNSLKTEKEYFPDVTVFNGGDKMDDSYTQLIFYPNGVCTEYLYDSEGISFCKYSYYINSNQLYIRYTDSRTVLIDIHGDSFQYRYLTLKKIPFKHEEHYFDEPTCFVGYTDEGEEMEVKYYPNGYCTKSYLNNKYTLKGNYSIREGRISVNWFNDTKDEYYYNTDAYEHNNIFFWKRGYFDAEEYH